MQRIILVGYMGSGKTIIGRVLAQRINLPFYDLDWYIEQRMRQSVQEIFQERGEEGFRRIEHNMLHEVAEFENIVLSCGGGTPCFFNNMDYLNTQGETIYLKASPEVLHSHLLIGKTVRPLIVNKTTEELHHFIEEQLEKREIYYNKARHIIDVSLMNDYEKINITVDKVLKMLNY